jgi:hypothetical protein
MGARKIVGKGSSYRPRHTTFAGGIDSFESIPGLLIGLKIRAQESAGDISQKIMSVRGQSLKGV